MLRLRSLRWFIEAVLALAIWGGGAQSVRIVGQEISIPDPELRLAIRHALGGTGDAIRLADIETLTRLDASRSTRFELRFAEDRRFREIQPIRSLEGLEHAVNLEYLDLSGNPPADSGLIIDAGPFLPVPSPAVGANLASDDLNGLAFLTQLKELKLEGNNLTTVSLPDSLTQLESLNLRGNRGLRAVQIPSSLVRLKRMNLRATQLQDYSFLAGLGELEFLDIAWNSLGRLVLPGGMDTLRVLNLDSNELQSLDVLDSVPSLETLSAASNRLTSVDSPSNEQPLISLNLSGNQLSEFSFLKQFPNLQILDVSRNQLEDFSVPPGVSGLRELNLSQNLLAEFSEVGKLPTLEGLDLSQNQLEHFELLSEPSNLKRLDISGNRIEELSLPEGSLANVVQLLLSGNQMGQLDLPEGMTSVAHIDLSRNRLQRLGFSHDLGELQTLDLSFNRLKTLNLPNGLERLSELRLFQNALSTIVAPIELKERELFGSFEKNVKFEARILTKRTAAGLELSWRTGKLQRAETVEGPWVEVGDATSPYVVCGPAPSQFFRLNPDL